MLALRLILVLVIAASAGVIALGELQLKPHLEKLAADQKKVTDERDKKEQDRAKQEARAKEAELQRDNTKNELDQSKKAEADAMKAGADARAAAAKAAAETTVAKQETDKVKVQSAEYFDLQKQGLTPALIKDIAKALPMATNELATLKQEQRLVSVQLAKASGELNAFLNPKGSVALPRELTGKVSVVDPKWSFVILNIGANHGLVKNGELTVHREGKLVARVKASSVETDYAIADVMPGFKQSEIHEGDTVLTPTSMVLPAKK